MPAALQTFLTVGETLFLTVREGRVPEQAVFVSLMQSLEELATAYREQEALPKVLVGVMLDISTAMYSAADLHEEPIRSMLYTQFDVITDKMRDLCY